MNFDQQPTGSDAQHHAPLPGGDPLPKGRRLYPVNRLRKTLRKPISDALAALRGKPFTINDSREAIAKVLRSINLNDYRDDIAWQVEEVERQKRNASFGRAVSLALACDDLFTEELAREVWIPLGDKQQVCLTDATNLHILHKRQEQQADVEKVVHARDNTDAFLAMLGREFATNPTETVAEAMRRIGRWGGTS